MNSHLPHSANKKVANRIINTRGWTHELTTLNSSYRTAAWMTVISPFSKHFTQQFIQKQCKYCTLWVNGSTFWSNWPLWNSSFRGENGFLIQARYEWMQNLTKNGHMQGIVTRKKETKSGCNMTCCSTMIRKYHSLSTVCKIWPNVQLYF